MGKCKFRERAQRESCELWLKCGVEIWTIWRYNVARKQERWYRWTSNQPWDRAFWKAFFQRKKGSIRARSLTEETKEKEWKEEKRSQYCRKRGWKMKLDIKIEQKWPLIVDDRSLWRKTKIAKWSNRGSFRLFWRKLLHAAAAVRQCGRVLWDRAAQVNKCDEAGREPVFLLLSLPGIYN